MLAFLGIGAQKAGTTWLYNMLSQHPDIHFPMRKEIHFWDTHYNGKNADNYFKFFGKADKLEGDITPAYGHIPPETISVIHERRPDLKLIYIIRDPVERAWSSALMALKLAEMEFEEASDQWFIDHFNSKGSRQRGDYETCIRNWLSFFPKEQLLILDYELLSQDPLSLLNSCCTYLSIPNFASEQIEKMNIHKKIFQTPKHPLRSTLECYLFDIYRGKSPKNFLANF